MSIVIRRGQPSDVDWMVSQMAEFSKFFNSRMQLFGDPGFIRAGLEGLIKNHIVFTAVGCHDGVIERMGFIIGLATPHPYNPAIRVLSEQFWWVEPKYRKSRAGLMLLNEFVAHGKAHSDWVLMALEKRSPVNEKTLVRRGFRHTETAYLLEVA